MAESVFSLYCQAETRQGYDPRPQGWGLRSVVTEIFDDMTSVDTYRFREASDTAGSPYPEQLEVRAVTESDGGRHFQAVGPFVQVESDRVLLPEAPDQHPQIAPLAGHDDDQYFAHRIVFTVVSDMVRQRQQQH
jgi:hypothetical protein